MEQVKQFKTYGEQVELLRQRGVGYSNQARSRQRNKDGRSVHEVWLRKYQSALKASKEDFVAHHKSKYGGTLPIWAAVEIMDWGMLSYLYGMSPNIVRKRIAQPCDLTGPQLESWLKSLNILRNYAAQR